MGYNISKNSVLREKSLLDDLLEFKKTVEIPSANPRKRVSKIWEALKSADALQKRHPEFEKYAGLRYNYRFRQIRTGVLCEWVGEELASPIESGISMKQSVVTPTRMDIPEARSLVDVIASAMRFADAPELRFPNAVLRRADMIKLYNWTTETEVKWTFIPHDDAGLTLTTREVPEEILWKPQEENDGKEGTEV